MEALLFTAVVVEDEGSSSVIRNALADVGCLDISTVGLDELEVSCCHSPDLVVIELADADVVSVRRIKRMFGATPLVVICSETAIEEILEAGASDAVTTPIRPIELVVRLRAALRLRAEELRRTTRERGLSDAMERLQSEKRDLERLACVDSLTGVANRRHALSLLDAEWGRSARERLSLALVMIDLDCYHAFNEQYGHLGGDSCLQSVCEAMVTCLRRPSDYLGRYGGEEFIAVLPSTDAAGAKIVAERLRAAVEALGIAHPGSSCSPVVTITAGFAAFEVRPDMAVDLLIGAADAALLHAKVAGRNRIDGDAPPIRPTRVSAQRWKRFAPVFTDPWFADRIPSFLAETREEASTIGKALRAGELERVRGLARQLRSAAFDFGFAEIERMADEVDRAARDEERRTILVTCHELLDYVNHVQVVYRRRLEVSRTLQSLEVTARGA